MCVYVKYNPHFSLRHDTMNNSQAKTLQQLSKKIAKKRKKKPAPRPRKPKNDAELRKELTELKKAARAQVRTAGAANKQAISFLGKMAELEAATEKLAALLRTTTTRKNATKAKTS